MRKNLSVIVCLLIGINVYGQEKTDCEKLLDKEFSMKEFAGQKEVWKKDFEQMIYCYHDSLDVLILGGVSGDNTKNIILAGLIAQNGGEYTDRKISLRELCGKVNEIKSLPEYKTTRKIVEAYQSMKLRKVDLNNQVEDSDLLRQIGYKKEQIQQFYGFVKENQAEGMNYFTVWQLWATELEHQKETKRSPIDKRQEGQEEWLRMWCYHDYAKGAEAARLTNKPILLYFTGWGDMNSRVMESKNFGDDQEIRHLIADRYVFIVLVVDDRTRLKPEEAYFSKVLNREVKYIGDQNAELELSKFQEGRQPLYLIVTADGKMICKQGYTEDIKKFRDFLEGN